MGTIMHKVFASSVSVIALLAVSGCSAPASDATAAAGNVDGPAVASDAAADTATPTTGGIDVLRKEYTDMPALTTNSDAIIIGRAQDSRVRTITGARNGSTEAPPTLEETYTTVVVDKTVRGTLPDTIEVSQLGSESGGYVEEGAPLLEKGSTYLLFLQKGPFGNYGVTGGRVVYEKAGAEFRRTSPESSTADNTARSRSAEQTDTSIPDTIPADQVEAVIEEAAPR